MILASGDCSKEHGGACKDKLHCEEVLDFPNGGNPEPSTLAGSA